MKGATTCRMHGASAGQVKAKAAARVKAAAAEADARRVLAHVALSRVEDPLQVLAETAAEAVAFKDALASRVNALEAMRYSAPGAGTEQLRAELAVYERALDRVARLSDMLAKHDFGERRLQLVERYGDGLASVVRAILSSLLGALLEALGEHVAARSVVESFWSGAVAEIVPRELRRMAEIGEGQEVVRGELG